MARRISITAGGVGAEATLNDSPTAGKIWEALPIEVAAQTWGDEIYFSIPVTMPEGSGGPEAVGRTDEAVGRLEKDARDRGACLARGLAARWRSHPDQMDIDDDEAQAVVELGDLGYWPPGRAFCIFFGPTPASQGDEIRPASPVNVVGRVDGDPTVFRKVRAGTRVRLERADAAERA